MPNRISGKTESLAFTYCLQNGFQAGFLIGKYGLKYVEEIDREELNLFEEHNRMYWEAHDAWEEYLKSDLESARKTLSIMKG